MIKSMGSIGSLMKMVPGMGKLPIQEEDMERSFLHMEAIISSMTTAEREDVDLLNGSRRKRIAKGSGRSVEEVNQLVAQFTQMRSMMKQFSKLGAKGGMDMLRRMSGMMRGR